MLPAITFLILLAACGGSEKDKLIGAWKLVVDDNIATYLEFGEERLIKRSQSDDSPLTAEYIITETQDDNFVIEVINPENGSIEFFLGGHFENKNKVKILETAKGPAENSELIRVDNIAEEREKEEKRLQEEEKKELAEEQEKNKKLQEEKEKELEEEKEKDKRLQEEKELAEEQEKETVKRQAAEKNSFKKEYLQKADNLENRIIGEAKKFSAHDMTAGFYGQYYQDWDDLLQEVWGVLRNTLSSDAFETLKSEQIEWIKMKERNFAEMPKEPASERARGRDYLAFETKERTYYLIENYMD